MYMADHAESQSVVILWQASVDNVMPLCIVQEFPRIKISGKISSKIILASD